MSAPKLLPTMRDPVEAGMLCAKQFMQKRGNHAEAHLNWNELSGVFALAFSLRDEQWAPEVERLNAERDSLVRQLAAQREDGFDAELVTP